MNPSNLHGTVPLVRVVAALRVIRYIQSLGAPVDRLLARSRIPAVLLDHPSAVIPMESALRFMELACHTLGTEHLGIHVGLANKLNDLGRYTEALRRSLTLREYLCKGISLDKRRLAEEGLTYSQLLTDTRLQAAADCLKKTDKPVGEIAFDIGYTDMSNFTRAFRRHTGVPPQVFRDGARSLIGKGP
jgi:AraC-like DNA-binding protein